MSLGGNFSLPFGRQSGHMLPFPIRVAYLTHAKELFKNLFLKAKKNRVRRMGDVKKTKRTETKKPYGCANTWRLQLRQNLLCKVWSLVGFAPLNFGAHCSHQCIDHVRFDLIHHFHKKWEIDAQHQQCLWKYTWAGWRLVAWFSGKWATFKTLFAVNARGEDSYGDECLSLWAPNTSWLSFG